MPNNTVPAAAEGLSKLSKEQEQAHIMFELESPICELFHMASIMADRWDRAFDFGAKHVIGGGEFFIVSVSDVEANLFASFDVQDRAAKVRAIYYTDPKSISAKA
ncbi:MAG: hypothetical protein ACREDP_24405 [Bradyrhizobium sp.]